MGLFTRLLRRSTLRVMSIAFCTPELMPAQSERFYYKNNSSRGTMQTYDSAQRGTLASVAEEQEENEDDDHRIDNPRTFFVIRSVQWASVLFDILDLINAILDLVFAVRLTKLPDATVYAVIVIVGLVLGRIILFRATWILFHGGIQIDPSLQEILQENSPFRGKNVVALQLLYCLAYSEAAAFLFENYPTLATYAFWRTISSTPSPLERIDQVNVIMTVVLCLTLAFILLSTTLFLIAWQGYLRFRFGSEAWPDKVCRGGKFVLGVVFVAAVTTFMWQIISLAWRVTVLDERVLPSGDLLWGWISICDDVESMNDRLSFCDERAFLIKTTLAWMLASYFAYFLFFEPAKIEETPPPTTTPTPDQTASGKDSTRVAVAHKDDTSTSYSGTDRLEDGEVESGRIVMATPRSPSELGQSYAPSRKVRSKPRNSERGAAPAHPPYRPTSPQATSMARPTSMSNKQPLEYNSHWTYKVPPAEESIPPRSPYHVATTRQNNQLGSEYRHRNSDKASETPRAIDPYGLGQKSPRPHAAGPGFDKKIKSLVPKSEPRHAPTPPDPFSSMAKFEVVLTAAETSEQKMKKSDKPVVPGSSKRAPTPPPNPFSSMEQFEAVLAAAEAPEHKARKSSKHAFPGSV